MHAQDAEREQQREGASVGCARPGDSAGGDGGEAGRALDGDDGGDMGHEGVDDAEQGASMAVREAEGSDDEDEVMAGKENMSMQGAEGGCGSTGGIVKKKRKRSRQRNGRQRQEMAMIGRRLAADGASVN